MYLNKIVISNIRSLQLVEWTIPAGSEPAGDVILFTSLWTLAGLRIRYFLPSRSSALACTARVTGASRGVLGANSLASA